MAFSSYVIILYIPYRKEIVGQNFRHNLRISSILSKEYLCPTGSVISRIIHLVVRSVTFQTNLEKLLILNDIQQLRKRLLWMMIYGWWSNGHKKYNSISNIWTNFRQKNFHRTRFSSLGHNVIKNPFFSHLNKEEQGARRKV